MKQFRKLVIGMLVLAFIAFIPGTKVFGQQQQQTEEEQKTMKLWMEYSTPGQNHKYLEYFVGNWEVTSKMWMKPGTEPIIDKAENTSEMKLGGRYLYSYLKGTMMGMPSEGMVITGYDNYQKIFNTLWVDSAGTGFFPLSGTLDSAGKTRTETGLWDNIVTGKKDTVKLVTTIIDKDKYTLEMYMVDEKGGEFKSMEITYTRKK
jgi:hypothetical protein